MRFAPLDRYFTGVSIPVAALRTAESCGVGEFADLPPLGSWCRAAGLEVIQLLPVNDTGGNSSPYSAISAFALHPLYLRLQALPGAGSIESEIQRFRKESTARENTARGRFSYRETLAFKLSMVERVYAENKSAILKDPGFTRWRADNPWVVPYAVFTALRKASREAPWSSWPTLTDADSAQISAWWDSHSTECLVPAWVQFQLETQLSAASRALEVMGVYLKGDLPILMSVDSADVWAYRKYFNLGALAGAPPDMFSPDGQNWGFPVYNWDNLGKDDYRWWKERLRQAGKFFHAFRIDHVLGFFRIWRIPRGEVTGLLGRFSPSVGLSPQDMQELGFDAGRLRWLSVPHMSGAELKTALGPEAPRVAELWLRRVGTEDLYNIAPEIDGESAIHALAEPPEVKGFLLSCHADRALLGENAGEDSAGARFPSWYMDRARGFQSLSEEEKSKLHALIDRRRRESEEVWESRGHELLSILRGATDMLVCAEDLGDVPRCVPRVLAELGILGLRIVRWSREYEQTGPGELAAFIAPARYPPLTVCTPSVHDTSTIRGWWEEDAAERELFFRSLGEKGACPPHMTARLLEKIVASCCGAGSILCMFQLQDLLDLDEALWARDPRDGRINVPGTVTEENWTWRMPLSVEELAARTRLSERIRALAAGRSARPLKGTG
jgi:4-alpha-glucanotransferase